MHPGNGGQRLAGYFPGASQFWTDFHLPHDRAGPRVRCRIGRQFLSGLLSPIPVLAWPLCIFVHVQQGSDGALAVLRGNLQGAYGVCVFYTVVRMLVRSWDPTLTYTIALLGSVLVSIPWLPRRQTARAA